MRTPGALLRPPCTHIPHAHTLTCVHTGARTHTNNKIEKKRIKVGEQSQETGSAQVRRVPAEGHWETRKCPRKSLGTRWEGRAVFQHTWRPDFCRTMWPVIPVQLTLGSPAPSFLLQPRPKAWQQGPELFAWFEEESFLLHWNTQPSKE